MDFKTQTIDFEPLKELIEKEQNTKTKIEIDGSNIIIKPFKDIPIDEKDLKVMFSINNGIVILKYLYLLKESKGTGGKILEWFINYCKISDYKVFKIWNVKDESEKMHLLCRKFGFVLNETSKTNDYYMEF